MPGSSDARPLPERDLSHVLQHTQDVWADLRDARLFVTGGTGFFGRWMVESFLRANDEFGLDAELTLLSRDPRAFAAAAPHINGHHAVAMHHGDVQSFRAPGGDYSHVLHLATESGPTMSPTASYETAVVGTQRVLAFARQRGATKLLLTSSGAVYGTQPTDCARLTEDHPGAPHPEDVAAGYGHGKRAAETLCAVAAAESDLSVKIARCFAFVGPLLPLDANFAIGNFIRGALTGDHVAVRGDGTPRRSYLYAADLAVWLWTVLVRGQSGRPYNVGSEEDLSIAALARAVARVVRPDIPIRVEMEADPRRPPARYVPSTVRAADELGLRKVIPLDEAIRRTADWHAP